MGGSLDQMPNYTFSDLTLQLLPKYIFYGSLMIFLIMKINMLIHVVKHMNCLNNHSIFQFSMKISKNQICHMSKLTYFPATFLANSLRNLTVSELSQL